MARTRFVSNASGFTIIEVLVAIAIFSIGLMAMGALQTSALMKTGDVTRKTEAWALLAEQAELLKQLPFYVNVGAQTHPPALDAGGFGGPRSVVSPDGRYTIQWQVVDDESIGLQGRNGAARRAGRQLHGSKTDYHGGHPAGRQPGDAPGPGGIFQGMVGHGCSLNPTPVSGITHFAPSINEVLKMICQTDQITPSTPAAGDPQGHRPGPIANQNGSVMVLALMIMAVMMVIVIASSDTVVTENFIIRNVGIHKENVNLVESALMQGLQDVHADPRQRPG